MKQDQINLPADMESLLAWRDAFVGQTWRFLLAIPLLGWLMPRPEAGFFSRLSKRNLVQLAVLFLFPMLMLLRRKSLVPSAHYLIPFLVMFFVWLGFFLARLPRPRFSERLLGVALPVLVMFISVGSTPAAMSDKLKDLTVCRAENRALHRRIVDLVGKGEKLWLDPYTPYDTQAGKDRLDISWVKTWREADERGFTVFVFNKGFMGRYTGEVAVYSRKENPDWEATQTFYRDFVSGAPVVSPAGHRFERIGEEGCGLSHEVWKRVN
ncbi:MAG: hypothetical protein HC902_08160 [Calothrix sp. SM1_5_4]|nr:hypothetical protein [Calothrix sp. SM1_5_4]